LIGAPFSPQNTNSSQGQAPHNRDPHFFLTFCEFQRAYQLKKKCDSVPNPFSSNLDYLFLFYYYFIVLAERFKHSIFIVKTLVDLNIMVALSFWNNHDGKKRCAYGDKRENDPHLLNYDFLWKETNKRARGGNFLKLLKLLI